MPKTENEHQFGWCYEFGQRLWVHNSRCEFLSFFRLAYGHFRSIAFGRLFPNFPHEFHRLTLRYTGPGEGYWLFIAYTVGVQMVEKIFEKIHF